MRRSIRAWLRGELPVSRLEPVRSPCLAAYDLVERLPRSPERSAAWAAYALLTYGDKRPAGLTPPAYVEALREEISRRGAWAWQNYAEHGRYVDTVFFGVNVNAT